MGEKPKHEPLAREWDVKNQEQEPHLEERFLQWLKEGYNPPGAPPTEAMWSAIDAGLSERRFAIRPGVLRIAAGVVLLVAGAGLGRLTAPAPQGLPDPGDPAASVVEWTQDGARPDVGAALLPTLAHLREAELLFSVLAEEGAEDWAREQSARWAESLLLETAILRQLHGEAGSEMVALLEELEVTLRLVAGLDESRTRAGSNDALRSITRTLADKDLRNRIHSVLLQRAS